MDVWFQGAVAGSGWGLVAGLMIALWVALRNGALAPEPAQPREHYARDPNLTPETDEPYPATLPARFGRPT